MPIEIRPYHTVDCAACRGVFNRAIREGAARYYTAAQRAAWAPDAPFSARPSDAFCKNLRDQQVFVAIYCEDGKILDGKGPSGKNDEIIGFMSLRSDGYLDLAFVLPCWMGRGVAQALYDRLTQWAQARGLSHLRTHASHFARSFFARNGWIMDHPETVIRDGQTLARFAMSIELSDLNDQTNHI